MNLDWLKQLATNDPLAALESAVRRLSEISLTGIERWKWLVAVDSALKPMADALARRYTEARRLPTEDETRLWDAGHGLHHELSQAYLSALHESPGSAFPGSEVPALVARILHHRGQAAAWHYFRYLAVPDGWWLATHQLYALAEHEKFSTKPVLPYAGEAPASCSSLYMKILLLDSLNRTNMTKQQIAAIDRWLQPWSVQTELEQDYREDEQMFFVNLGEDKGGRRIRNFEPTADCRYWNTDAIIAEIESLLDQHPLDSPDENLEPALLRQLHAEWSRTAYKRQRRLDERDAIAKRASVAHGIYAVCQEVRSQTAGGSMELGGELWQLENESRNGFGALVSRELNSWLKIGRLIALREEMNLGMSMVGVVRSLQQRTEGKVYVGVEVLSHMALYGSLQEVASVAGSQPFPCVFLPSDDERGLTSCLLIPAIEYPPGTDLSLRIDRRVHYLRLGQLIEQKDDWVRMTIGAID